MIAFLAVVAGVALGACGPNHHSTIPVNAPSEYPGVLHDPKTLPHDFMVRQSLTIKTKRDGKPVEAELDAVLQKNGDTLLIVGFGPANVKAFTLTQRGDQIEFVQFMGPQLPFSPRNIVVDVHRVFFKRLPAPTDAAFSGVLRGTLDGEQVEETWHDGQLRFTVFTRPAERKLTGAIRVELGPGCRASKCEPESSTLVNEWFDYSVAVVNGDFEALRP